MSASSSKLRKRIVVLVLGILISAGSISVWIHQEEEQELLAPTWDTSWEFVHAPPGWGEPSPTPDEMKYMVQTLHRDLPEPIMGANPQLPFPEARIRIEGAQVGFEFDDWPDKPNDVMLRNPWFGQLIAPFGNVVELPEEGRLTLEAFGVAYQDVNQVPNLKSLQLRDGETRSVLSDDELDGLGIPSNFRKIDIGGRKHPVLRLILRHENLADLRVLDSSVYDGWTGRYIFHHESRYDEASLPDIQRHGEWTLLDFELSIWHSTIARIGIDITTGQLREGDLRLNPNEQIVLGDLYRLGCVFLAPGDLRKQDLRPKDPFADLDSENWADYELAKTPGPGSSVILLMDNNAYRDHFVLFPHLNALDDFDSNSSFLSEGLNWHTFYMPNQDLSDYESIRCGIFPHRSRVWFEIEELDDMPNPHAVENLFEVRIPYVDFNEDDNALWFISNATEMSISTNLATTKRSFHSARTFHDTTPRQLLEIFLEEANPHLIASTDSEDRTLKLRQKRPPAWPKRLLTWCGEKWDDLLGGN
ncbi:MAG: hypothetical protein AAF585_01275 [Verrucomicrobiota bacterium]